jgi:hypothetical protein
MSRTRYQAKELGTAKDKVDNLGNEEEKKGLAEMTEYADDRKSHAREIAESVPHKGAGRKPARFVNVVPTDGKSEHTNYASTSLDILQSREA